MRVHTVVALSACFAAAFAAGSATSAAARPSESAALVLTTEGSSGTAVAELRCEPTGGTHAQAPEACSVLAGVDGDFDDLDVAPGTICPTIYDPVVVTAKGQWRGTLVDHVREYANTCELRAATGPVFAL
ncbi:SSI family serine proteinase inhibitor [Phytomonospora endophytica]|uniref:Subtilisin inhibitor domain-containing protein n=1 Tax=Phytomonospora endophytica TaxID=714109 RepID=A0A841FKP8_9ACTN|nr:SSI family serine proteinase inhibitor [Phytomonospora endophytica]MBB6035493.1 hypothetical protein [Phytomonospora endophytica]GIG63754.1 hypothetical protein Pen01_00490 [Phytomonospora endophytica]